MKKIIFILTPIFCSIRTQEHVSLLKTPHLTLQYANVNDRHNYQDLMTSSDEVCQYLVGGKITAEELKTKFNSVLAKTYFFLDFAARNKTLFGKPIRGFRWKIISNETQKVIGYVALKNKDSAVQHLLPSDNYKSLSIFFDESNQHKGYFKEILTHLLPVVFTYTAYKDADGIVGMCAKDNHKMIQCIQKYADSLEGFSDTGTQLIPGGTTLVPEQTLFRIFTFNKSGILNLKSPDMIHD